VLWRKAEKPATEPPVNGLHEVDWVGPQIDAEATSKQNRHQVAQMRSWRDVLPIHPAADLFPMMSRDELLELGEDIKKHGLTSPIVLWSPDDKRHATFLLDGRNRLDAMEAAGIKVVDKEHGDGLERSTVRCRHLFETGGGIDGSGTQADPFEFAISANINRRHLGAEQRGLIAKLLKAAPEKSNRQIAETAKADHKTVGAVRQDAEARGEIPHVEKHTDTRGRRQPTKKEKRRDADDFKKDTAAKKATVVAPAVPAKIVRDVVAPDQELALLREFACFVICRTNVKTAPKDHPEWRAILDRVKAALGGVP
jgi:hypothetical protein